MEQTKARRGTRRLVLAATAAMVGTALATVPTAPASAAPVAVTTTVTDAAGNAVDGVVRAWEVTESGTWQVDQQEVSGGMVDLRLEPGSYKLEFAAEGFLSEFYSDKATLEAADAIDVSGPVALPPVSLAPAGAIRGAVTDEQGRPLPSVNVSAEDVDTRDEVTGHTAKDGTFSLPAEPGSYKLYVSGTSVGDTYYSGEYYNNKATFAEADAIAQTAAGVDVGTVALTTGAVIRGRVTGAGNAPLERVWVSAYQPDCTVNCTSASDHTDAAGNYALEGVAPGSYVVQFSDPAGEYESEYLEDATDLAGATRVEVAKDQVLGDVDVSLTPRPAEDPATVDVAGRVVDSNGVPVIGARVVAHSTPARRKNVRRVEEVRTNRQGYYAFRRLDPASSGVGEDTFKIEASDPISGDDEFRRLGSFFGGAVLYDNARTLTLPSGGQVPGVNITLPLTGGISGRITSEAGEPVMRTWASFLNEDGNRTTTTYAGYDGRYQTRGLPAGTYKVQFGDNGYYLIDDPDSSGHVPEWHSNAVSAEEARKVVVRSGQMTTGVNAALAVSLKAVQKPEIGGKPYVGKKVTALPGRWTMAANTRFSYQWLVNGQVVGTQRTLAVNKKWFGKRLTLRVAAENGTYTGTALVTSQKLKREPKIRIRTGQAAVIQVKASKVKAKQVKGNVTVREIVRIKANGKPKYKKIGGAKIKAGKARVSLAKVKGKGKHTLVFTFRMKGKVGNAEVTKKVKRAR